MNDEPGVKVTLKEIYDLLIEMRTILNPLPQRVDDHESRLRGLERKVWSLPSFATVVSVISLGITFVKHFL